MANADTVAGDDAVHADTDGTGGTGGVESASTDVYDDVIIEMRRVLKVSHVAIQRQIKTFNGVAPALFGILSLLYREGPKRTTTIAENLHVDVSVASRQIGELEQGGLVERRRDPSDARAFLVAATETGADTVLAVREQQRQLTRVALSEWDTDELRSFATALRRFGDDMTRSVLTDPDSEA